MGRRSAESSQATSRGNRATKCLGNYVQVDPSNWSQRMMNKKENANVVAILVDPREAARRLAISPRTLWQLTKDRVVPSMKIGKCVRYRVADLEDWTRRQIETGA